jgi:uncharacterized protein (DUF1501 family)
MKTSSMKTNPFLLSRRQWLQRNSLALAGALGTSSLGNLLVGPRTAQAADYQALVCVFLYGGNDGLNMVVPTGAAVYNQYAGVRAALAIPQANLLPLAGVPYGLHPSMAALAPAWAEGRLAPVFNVGPLAAPLTKAQYRAAAANSPLLPDSLFSNADQQILWETGSTDSKTRSGWGGRAAATLQTTNPVISLAGTARYGQSDHLPPLVLPDTPGANFGAIGLQSADIRYEFQTYRKTAIDTMYAQAQDADLADAFTASERNAFAMSERLSGLVKSTPGSNAVIDAAFAPMISGTTVTNRLGKQLYQVAKLIAGRTTVQSDRQIFFTSLGGFDTHGDQVGSTPLNGSHANLLKELADALACFHNAMKGLGMANAVTAFTQSDFGRTFTPNSSRGTDHAWGNTHLVLGGAVRGGAGYGTYPTLVPGGVDDVGVDSWERQGRWIPTTSVDQYAATLLGWFGASDVQLTQVLPNLADFGTARRLGFL